MLSNEISYFHSPTHSHSAYGKLLHCSPSWQKRGCGIAPSDLLTNGSRQGGWSVSPEDTKVETGKMEAQTAAGQTPVSVASTASLSQILFINGQNSLARPSYWGVPFFFFEGWQLLFADEVVLFASSDHDLQILLEQFTWSGPDENQPLQIRDHGLKSVFWVGEEVLSKVEEFK